MLKYSGHVVSGSHFKPLGEKRIKQNQRMSQLTSYYFKIKMERLKMDSLIILWIDFPLVLFTYLITIPIKLCCGKCTLYWLLKTCYGTDMWNHLKLHSL